jgi:hypothetical protein
MSRSHLINGLLILAVGFITIHYRYIDGLLFPINDHDTLVVGMVQPYDRDKVVGKVSALIEREREGERAGKEAA